MKFRTSLWPLGFVVQFRDLEQDLQFELGSANCMRIAFLVMRLFPDAVGGAEYAALRLASILHDRGHEICVFSTSSTAPRAGYPFRHTIIGTPITKLQRMLASVRCIFSLMRFRPEIIHVHGAGIMIFPAVALRILRHTPFVVYCVGSDVYSDWSFKSLLLKCAGLLGRHIIVPTSDMRLALEKTAHVPPETVLIIPTGVDLRMVDPASRTKVRRAYNLPRNAFVSIFVGRLTRNKGVEFLIEAAALVPQLEELRVIVVGDGEEKCRLMSLAQKRGLTGSVLFLGKRDHEEVLSLMEAADVVVMPSLSEGLPLVLLEAMASGLPVIATDLPGLRDVLGERQANFLVPPRDSAAIARQICQLIASPHVREMLREENLMTITRYSWINICDELERSYGLRQLRNPSSMPSADISASTTKNLSLLLGLVLFTLVASVYCTILAIRRRVSIIHSQDTVFAGLARVVSSIISRTPLVLTAHGVHVESANAIFKGPSRGARQSVQDVLQS